MMVRKFISICIVVFLVLFLFTSTSFIPKLELVKEINAMEIFKMFVFPARTLFYLNKIFTGERKEIPLTSSRKGSRDTNTFKLLILSIMTAILLPVSIKLIRPDLMPHPMLVTLYGRGSRSPPDSEINTCISSRTAFGRQNNRRERKSRSYSSVAAKADIADDSGSEPEISNNPYLIINNQHTATFNPKNILFITRCKRLHNTCVNTDKLVFNLITGGSL